MSSQWLQNKLAEMKEKGKVITYSPEESSKIMERMNEKLKKINFEYKKMVRKTNLDPRIHKPLL